LSTDPTAAAPAVTMPETLVRRALDNIRGGTLGSWPVLIGLAVIAVFFSFKADNFLSPGNFSNIITQMAGVTLLAYGVVFVLLIGEIDLSISYISGIAGVVVAKLTVPDGNEVAGIVAILIALAVCALIGAFQGSFVAFIGVPAFVVTLAGYQIWQGVIQKSIEAEGVIVIQDETVNNTANYFFSDKAGWIIAALVLGVYIASVVSTFVSHRRHGVAVRDPWLIVAKVVAVVALTVVVVVISNRDRGVPFVLLLMIASLLVLTFVAKRTTFGRHVYAVGGNAEAARRAGINVARVRVIVFMISGVMAGLGGVVLAGRLNSVDLNAGGGTLLIDAIAAAVIGGTSLFGGRGEVKDALLGALVIATIANGLNTLNLTQGVIFITTGAILLFAVTLDTILRRRQRAAGR
jgi:D-xylose transport system permease protein